LIFKTFKSIKCEALIFEEQNFLIAATIQVIPTPIRRKEKSFKPKERIYTVPVLH